VSLANLEVALAHTPFKVASQMAKYMTKSLNTMAKGQSLDSRSTFEWKNKGSMVSLGERAVSPPKAYDLCHSHLMIRACLTDQPTTCRDRRTDYLGELQPNSSDVL
jgi:hypothetical protein